jgi:hypothetical protein
MQSVCSVIPAEFNRQVIEARAELSEDPLLGAIFDPPFAHFTHQLAEEYDWDGLEVALRDFAAAHEPFEARTIGLLVATGEDTGITVGVYRSAELIAYHQALWDAISPFARGKTRGQDEPPTWLPHITIKRCEKHFESFGAAMTKLSRRRFVWTMTIDNVSVQHDPGKNSLTHYQRLNFRLGGGATPAVDIQTNANIVSVSDVDGAAAWALRVVPDGAAETSIEVAAADMVRIMAACNASMVHFAGGRCQIADGKVVAVAPKTPYPAR